MPVDLLADAQAPAASSPSSASAPKDLLADKPAETGPKEPKDDSIAAGMTRGFLERGTGVDQLLNQLGAGGAVPVFKDGKLTLGLPPNEELAKREKDLEKQGVGTGVTGEIGEIAGDPVTYMPLGKAAKAEAWAATGLKAGASKLAAGMSGGGIQAALSSFLSPTDKKDETIATRLEDAGIAAPVGMATGGILHALSNKIFATPTGELTKGSPIYDTVTKMGIRLTGKETPEEVWSKVQTAVKAKVSDLAEKVDKGSSASDMWNVSSNLATSKMYEATRQAGGVLFGQAKAMGDKLEAPAESITKDIGSLIEQAEKDTASASLNPKFSTALTRLREIKTDIETRAQKAVGDDPWAKILHMTQHGEPQADAAGTVTGSHLIEIDQALNQLYGKSGQGGSAGKLYSELQSKVNSTIKSMSPEFGAAYQKAKDYWKTQVINNFKENKALQAFWKPEDYDAYAALQKGLPLHPNVKTRVTEQLDKIKTWNDLDVLKNQLPPEMYDTVRAQKFIALMDKYGIDAKALGDDKNYALLAKTLGDKPNELHALDAIKTFAEQMKKRGITGKLSPDELQESEKLKDRSIRTILGFATSHKLYGLTHAWDLLRGNMTVEEGELGALAKDVAKGTPKPKMEPGALSGAIGNAATRAAATKEGMQ